MYIAVAADCENGTVRLDPFVNITSNEGYVQLCIANHWRTLCGETFSRVDANVVCRQLGYSDEGN